MYDFSELNVTVLEMELIEDIEKDLVAWLEFLASFDREETMLRRNDIRQRIAKLRKFGGV